MAANDPGSKRLIGPRKKVTKRKKVPSPNQKAYQNANENASFRREAAGPTKAAKVAAKKSALGRVPVNPSNGGPSLQEKRINIKPGSGSVSRNNGPLPVIGTPNGGSKVMLPPDKVPGIPGTGPGPSTNMPIKSPVGPSSNGEQRSPGKSASAPGRMKKVLGLQSARTLTKPAMRSVAKPPTSNERPKAKVKAPKVNFRSSASR
jgi:hypothetical protein